MSMDATDFFSGESECCGAPLYLTGICSECGEHSEPSEDEPEEEVE